MKGLDGKKEKKKEKQEVKGPKVQSDYQRDKGSKSATIPIKPKK